MGNKTNLLQERISELGSGIIILHSDHIEVRGFLSPERLSDFLNGKDCSFSHGRYPNQILSEELSKDNAYFIIKQNDKVIKQWRFEKLFDGTVKLKIKKRYLDRSIIIRKDVFSFKYHFIGDDKNILFNDFQELTHYLSEQYSYELTITPESN